MMLRLADVRMDLSRPRVMGVLNVTPDSFSDGGRFLDPADALDRAAEIVAEGADLLDIGAESTRPGAGAVTEQEELDRLLPVLEAVTATFDIPVSVDTSRPAVMRMAVSAGARFINDVRALRADGALAAVAELDVPVCLMHMLGTPGTMQNAPSYRRLPGDIVDFLAERADECVRAGIARDRLVVDPGFGFGKTDSHNLVILANLNQFAELDLPLLVGLSRKRTLGNLTGRAPADRAAAGLAAAVIAVLNGASIVRTHDVAGTVDALKIARAVMDAGMSR